MRLHQIELTWICADAVGRATGPGFADGCGRCAAEHYGEPGVDSGARVNFRQPIAIQAACQYREWQFRASPGGSRQRRQTTVTDGGRAETEIAVADPVGAVEVRNSVGPR